MSFFKKLTKAISNKKYRLNPSKEDLLVKQLVSLSVGAINAEQRSYYCDSLRTGGEVNETAQGLAVSYGILDRDTALDTLTWLKERGHRVFFEAIHTFVSGRSSGIIDDYLEEGEKKETYTYINNLKDTTNVLIEKKYIENINDLNDTSIVAWDMARLVLVARSCYECGYMSEQEAWEYINIAYDISNKSYSNWKEFATGYVIGRSMWGGNTMSLSGIMQIANGLLKDEQSPWTLYAFL